MIKLYDGGAYLVNGNELSHDGGEAAAALEKRTSVKTDKQEAAIGTIA